MTLIIANRIDKEVSFSSDSRITFDNQGYFDKGIKLFSVPFKLKGPAKSKEDFGKYEFEHKYGIAVVGSSINAYTIKDSIAEVLPNMTYLSNMSDVSLPSLGTIIYKAYKEISEELSPILREKGLCELLIGGFCLNQKRVRVLRFYPIIKSEKVEYFFEEILKNDEMLFYGSGKSHAEEIYKNDKSLEPLQIIKKVISKNIDSSVGGPMQHGTFHNENFKILGVNELELDKNGMLKKSTYFRRAFEVGDVIEEALKPPYLSMSYAYKRVKITNDEQ